MDIEQPNIENQTYSYDLTQPTTNSSSLSECPSCLCGTIPQANQQQTLTLSQRDFVNSDLVLQYLFLYVLRKTGGEQESIGYLRDGCQYLLCKYFSAQYSVGYNNSLKVRINYLDPLSRDASRIVCQPIVLARTMKSRQTERVEACQYFNQSMNRIQGNNNINNAQNNESEGGISENVAVIQQIEGLVNQYASVLQEQELQEIGNMILETKRYLQSYHERMKQIKRYHILSERRLQEICENRLRLMEKVAKDWVAKYCEETDFVLITCMQADFSAERQRMKQLDLNPAFLSLLGTESSQFTNLIMRHGLQLCHNETNIVEALFGFTEWLIQNKPDVYEFERKNQTIVLIDKVVTTCDVQSICFQNLWDEQEPFTSKQNTGQNISLDAVVVSRFIVPPEQIKEILAIRMEHQSLDLVQIQEASLDYTVQSETFCEKYYPDVKAELEKIDRENNQAKKMCVTKNIQ